MGFLSGIEKKLRKANPIPESTYGWLPDGFKKPRTYLALAAGLASANPYVATSVYQAGGGDLEDDFGLPGWTNYGLTAANLYGAASGSTAQGFGDLAGYFGTGSGATGAFAGSEAGIAGTGAFSGSTAGVSGATNASLAGSSSAAPAATTTSWGDKIWSSADAAPAATTATAPTATTGTTSQQVAEAAKTTEAASRGTEAATWTDRMGKALTSDAVVAGGLGAGVQLIGGLYGMRAQAEQAEQAREDAKDAMWLQLQLDILRRQYMGGGGGGGGGGSGFNAAQNQAARNAQIIALQNMATNAQKAYLG